MRTSQVLTTSFIIVGVFIVLSIAYYLYEQNRIVAKYDKLDITDLSEVDWSDEQSITDVYVNSYDEETKSFHFVETVPENEYENIEPSYDPLNIGLEEEFETYITEESPEEYCCPDESRRDVRAEFIAKHGETPEVFEYLSLGDKQRNREILTADESFRFFELLAKFTPTPENLEAWEVAQKFFTEMEPGSFVMRYGD